MNPVFNIINNTFGTKECLLIIHSCSFLFKFIFLLGLFCYAFHKRSPKRLLIPLIFVFIGSMMKSDIGWIPFRLHATWLPSLDFRIVVFVARIAWAFFIVQNISLILFMENLVFKRFRAGLLHSACFGISFVLICALVYVAIFCFNTPIPSGLLLAFEVKVIQTACLVSLIMLLFTVLRIMNYIGNTELPKVLVFQTKTFLKFLILPHFFFEIITNKLFYFPLHLFPLNRLSIIGVSTLLIAYALYYCCKRLIGLRFLDVHRYVTLSEKFSFITNFRDILEQLSFVTNMAEMAQITRLFFKTAFGIPLIRTKICILQDACTPADSDGIYAEQADLMSQVERFLFDANQYLAKQAAQTLKNTKIFFRDEIAYSNFYEQDSERTHILQFLDAINADIFLPIYKQCELTGYIIVERNDQSNHLYTSAERDEMLVFTNYLSNIVNILRQNNMDELLRRQKELHEELHQKHQEVNQYKESIRSFFKKGFEREVGIVFYKSCHFRFANYVAEELVGFDLNRQVGDPLAVAFSSLAAAVQQYKTPQQVAAKALDGSSLVLNGVAGTDTNSVMILVYRPEVSDLIARKTQLLKDPSKLDYLLYLETTKTGQLINKLIPGSSEVLLDFKITLLQNALSRKATLLQLPDDDLKPTVELLHHVSLRQKLHILSLNEPEQGNEIALKLFGLHPLYGGSKAPEGLLELLNGSGTLFIQNIHFLSKEAQDLLAEFIAYGFFKRVCSTQKKFADVRIICSSPSKLELLVKEGGFSEKLYNELQKMVLSLPALALLANEEVTALADGFCQEALAGSSVQRLLDLTHRDKDRLLNQRPISLTELKNRVQQLLAEKSQKKNVTALTQQDAASDNIDPEVTEVIRMGKKALRDRSMMALLWRAFDKNQNLIAQALGVHRSSVNRRCQEYGLKR